MKSPKVARVLHEFLLLQAQQNPDRVALTVGEHSWSYGDLTHVAERFSHGLIEAKLCPNDRVAIFLPKRIETVAAMFGTSIAGGVFVPINPVLKAAQVSHVLLDSGAAVLVTTASRYATLQNDLLPCTSLHTVVLVDSATANAMDERRLVSWTDFLRDGPSPGSYRLENDIAALFYTSGSTGKPKGVVLAHRNLVVGGFSVAEYLENHPDDRILSLLPLSFDAGFSQLTTAFSVGARVILLDYLVPRDVVRVCERESITGITGVPPLWMQLVDQKWSSESTRNLRYFANTGGKMPQDTLAKLRATFLNAKPYLMYGLTEAFRSTYLAPEEVDRRPDSIGKAIPNVDVQVVRPDGTRCDANEPGELVHRGPLVSLGYWNDPEKTAERFRPAPGQPNALPMAEIAVWSGDTVERDADGYLYFVGRKDDMIKTSGYRVSPTEVEEVAFESGLVSEAVAVGVPHEALGQMIVVLAKPLDAAMSVERLSNWYREKVPLYMVPQIVRWRDSLPRNPNGKIDRVAVKAALTAEMTFP